MNKYYYPHTQKSKTKSKEPTEFTAKDAKRSVEKNVKFTSRNASENLKVKVGYPKYKDELGGWLVPAYDKKTGKFVGSVYVYNKGGTYSHGPEVYSQYKKIISGKYKHDSKTGIPVEQCG